MDVWEQQKREQQLRDQLQADRNWKAREEQRLREQRNRARQEEEQRQREKEREEAKRRQLAESKRRKAEEERRQKEQAAKAAQVKVLRKKESEQLSALRSTQKEIQKLTGSAPIEVGEFVVGDGVKTGATQTPEDTVNASDKGYNAITDSASFFALLAAGFVAWVDYKNPIDAEWWGHVLLVFGAFVAVNYFFVKSPVLTLRLVSFVKKAFVVGLIFGALYLLGIMDVGT